MSKMDALRAMREARYAEMTARAAAPAPATPAPRGKPAPPTAPPVAPPPAAAVEGLCGHRNMGGRTCTREQGHAAKSHRYS
jgi:hypothetical protein